MPDCLIEQSVTTAVYSLPITQGWLEPANTYILERRLTAEAVRSRGLPALLGAVEAARLADEFVVLADVALVSQHNSSVAMQTSERPDALDQVSVGLDDVSLTAEALARATVTAFYGISVTAWSRDSAHGSIMVIEDAAALAQPLSERLHDLGRAWFILTSLPFPSHVLVVPRRMVADQGEALRRLVTELHAAREAAMARQEELLEQIVREHALNRERVNALLADQAHRLTQRARMGWRELLHRTGRDLGVPGLDRVEIVSLS
ncbi:Chorismate dehydratase [bacterium HR26]|nr:Chorismate dehydratase [bacterium HR26]